MLDTAAGATLRFVSLLMAAMLACTCILGNQDALAADRNAAPNIVLIMADDLGIECLGSYGSTSYKTPHLDELAATGARFTNCFSTPKCSPSRVTIMTGRYTIRTTLQWGVLPQGEITFGHLLRNAGYATALAGKWQMGRIVDETTRVRKAGFDESAVWGWHEGPRYWKPLVYHNAKPMTDIADRYGPDVYCDFLIRFIEEQTEEKQPFLAYYPMALTHFPKKNEPRGPNGRHQTFAQMVSQMDRQVGKLVAALDRLKIRDNTLILFTADNGSPITVTSKRKSSDGKSIAIRGGKGRLTDAGTRVPLLANWRGVIKPETVNEHLIDFTDFVPTLTELGRATMPAGVTIDGQSFAWQLLGREGQPRNWVFTEWNGRRWIRDRRWKLYESGKLFDMVTDPSEKKPLESDPANTQANAARERLQTALDELLASAKKRPRSRRKHQDASG